jgi:GMP synthase-like glutamine amidotransferase
MATSPTQLSLKRLREEGYLCEVVEKWNQFARIRQDLFGFIDIIAISEGQILGVQSTSYSNISARVAKITDHENLPMVRKAGIRIEVHGWRKVKNRWEVKIVDMS